jgi:glycosyltransferase involved in cell wall biosynthesis
LDSSGAFVSWHKGVPQHEVANYYHAADGFIFASTCENMPNILIEAMASGLPIACSSYGPMPEFLKDGGVYMDPEKISEIEAVLEKMILSAELRERISAISYSESQNFNWNKCANETFSFLYEVVDNNK